MTWLRRYRIRHFLKGSVWFIPCLALLAAQLFISLCYGISSLNNWKTDVSIEGDRAVFGAMAASMLTFIVFVFSMLMVVLQLASAQLSPRVIAMTLRDRVTKIALTVFVFSFALSLAVVRRIDTGTPQLLMWTAKYSSIVSVGIYLYLIDHVGHLLRPVSLMERIAANGRKVIETVYPLKISEMDVKPLEEANFPANSPGRIVEHKGDGVLLAFDQTGLVELARRADCVIELIPQVGDFVAKGTPLFKLHGGTYPAEEGLRDSIALGSERTSEQDPAFAFRIIVDIASKALSAAINDPTTAVLALDQLQHLLRSVGSRRLDTGLVRDNEGKLRFAYRTPNWEDFVALAVTEIRHYGKDSIQIARRMRAMLEDLMKVMPERRAAQLRQELDLLHRSVESNFSEPEDRARAHTGDSQGIGGSDPVQ